MNQGHYPRATLDKSRTRSREMEVLFLTSLAFESLPRRDFSGGDRIASDGFRRSRMAD